MNPTLKLRHTVDALFGNGVSRHIPNNVKFTFSRKTGRIRTVTDGEKLFCTLRIDGSLAITIHCAKILLQSKRFKENCIAVSSDAAPFVERGRSVFCKHVLWHGKNIHISDDVPILFEDTVIAVGKAVLSSEMIPGMTRGVAVKIREGLKSSKGDLKL